MKTCQELTVRDTFWPRQEGATAERSLKGPKTLANKSQTTLDHVTSLKNQLSLLLLQCLTRGKYYNFKQEKEQYKCPELYFS